MMRRIMFFFAAIVLALAICLLFSWIDVHGEPACPDTPTPTPTQPPPDTATPTQPDTATPTQPNTAIPPTYTATATLPGGTPKAMFPPGNPHSTPGLIPPVAVTFTPTATPDTPWNEKTPVVLPVTGYEPRDNGWLYLLAGAMVVFGLMLFAVGRMRGGNGKSDNQ